MDAQAERLARTRLLAEAAQALGAGIGGVGRRFLTEEGRQEAAAKAARAKQMAGDATRADAEGAAWHPITMADIGAEGEAAGLPGAPAPALPPLPGPAARPTGALPVFPTGGPPPTRPAMPPPLPLGREPSALPPRADVAGAPPPPPPVRPYLPPTPGTERPAGSAPPALPPGIFNLVAKGLGGTGATAGAPPSAPPAGPMGKAPSPEGAPGPSPSLGGFASRRNPAQKEIERARRFALVGKNPGLAANLTLKGLDLAASEDPDAVARDNVKIARALSSADPKALDGVEVLLETRAGREAFAAAAGTIGMEGRKNRGALDLQAAKDKAEGERETTKHGRALELEQERTRRARGVAQIGRDARAVTRIPEEESAAILEVSGDVAALKDLVASKQVTSGPGILKVLAQVNLAQTRAGTLPKETGAQVDRLIRMSDMAQRRMQAIMKKVEDQYPDEWSREDDPDGYAAAMETAQKEAKPFYDSMVKHAAEAERLLEGGAAPAGEPAPPPGDAGKGASPPPAAAPAPAKPEGAKAPATAEDYIDRMADLDPTSEEYAAMKREYAEKFGGTKTKAWVKKPAAPAVPSKEEEVDPEVAAGRAVAYSIANPRIPPPPPKKKEEEPPAQPYRPKGARGAFLP